MWQVPLFDLSYDSHELDAVTRVLSSRWLSSGPETAAFEAEFSEFLGGDVYCTAVSSCTAALQMALELSRIGPGDEVVIPALTFVADLNVVQTSGAVPKLADCTSLNDWNVSAESIEQCLTSNTKAVIVVHYAGFPCDMKSIIELCKVNGIILIEDCAHAPGTQYLGRHCGTFGDISCFSFFSNKNLSVGEGGMLATKDKENAEKSKLYRSHGMTSMTVDRHAGKGFSYDVHLPGYNFRTDEIRSALGRVQLAKLEENNQKRGQLWARYQEILQNMDEVTIPFQQLDYRYHSSFHIFPILLDKPETRQRLMKYLKDKGIQASIHYPPMDEFTYYKDRLISPPIAKDISTKTLTLPLYPDLQEEELCYVSETVKEFFANQKGGV